MCQIILSVHDYAFGADKHIVFCLFHDCLRFCAHKDSQFFRNGNTFFGNMMSGGRFFCETTSGCWRAFDSWLPTDIVVGDASRSIRGCFPTLSAMLGDVVGA